MSSIRTIYLDLNHWYALGEALDGHPRQAGDLTVLGQLLDSVQRGHIIVPISAVHYMELAENPRDHQRESAAKVMILVSRFSTITSVSKIIDEELALAFNKHFGRPAFPVRVRKFGVGSGFAFGQSAEFRLTGGAD